MRTLHVGLRVGDLQRSLAFYQALGYEVVGSVPGTSLGQLTMLRLPDDEFVTIELVSTPPEDMVDVAPGLNHLVINVESLEAAVSGLATVDVDADDSAPTQGPDDIRTRWISDPDGNRIELVQWPAGHPDGLTAADWPDHDSATEGRER